MTQRGASVVAALVFAAILSAMIFTIQLVTPEHNSYAQTSLAPISVSSASQDDSSNLDKRYVGTGNAQRHEVGTCTIRYICGNDMLYYRTDECVDQPLAFCPRGCSAGQCHP